MCSSDLKQQNNGQNDQKLPRAGHHCFVSINERLHSADDQQAKPLREYKQGAFNEQAIVARDQCAQS